MSMRKPPLIIVHVKPGKRGTRVYAAPKYGENGLPAFVVEVPAVPEKGRANAAVIRALASTFDLPLAAFEIVSGMTSRRKRVRVDWERSST